MNYINRIYMLMLTGMVLFASCSKDGPDLHDSLDDLAFDKTLTPLKLSELKAMYTGTDVTLGKNKIFGVVMNDIREGNVLNNGHTIIIQEDSTGIAIPLLDYDAYTWALYPGDSIIFNITDAVLTRRNGMLQLTGVSRKRTQMIAIDRHVVSPNLKPRVVTLAQLSANFAAYECTLVKVDAAPAPAGTYEGDKALDDGSGGDIKLHTEAGASFADSTMPARALFTGVAIRYNAAGDDISGAVQQLWLRSLSDVTP